MKEILIPHIILFALAVLSVHLVSWVGSVLHSIPNSADSVYAVFTFRSDQDKPMSTNLLMNVLFPNVLLILFFLICYQLSIPYQSKQLFFYVPYYYLYRFILICVILRRKELYSLEYELTNTILGIGIAIFLIKVFLNDPSKVFIPVSEMINEFWLIIFLLVYKFLVLLLDKVFNQKTVVGDRRLNRYILKQFDRFLKKYEEVTYIGKDDRIVWILLYSIMIFEDYNRGPFVRLIERLKILFHHKATVGIMQIASEHNLSDKESIIEAYNLLRYEIMQGDLETDDEMQIKYYAYQYNSDENYSKSVAYIFEKLYRYIDRHPKYCRKFNMDNHGATEPATNQETNQEMNSQLTIDDLVQMTGLSRDELYEKIIQANMTVFLLENEVTETFDISHED